MPANSWKATSARSIALALSLTHQPEMPARARAFAGRPGAVEHKLRRSSAASWNTSPRGASSAFYSLVDCSIFLTRDAASLQLLNCAKEIDQRAAEPVDRPCHDNVKTAPLGVFQHFV
jgi:hypothetical protein